MILRTQNVTAIAVMTALPIITWTDRVSNQHNFEVVDF